jgi:N-acetylglucosaminyl-diphospho-decaprenol L-rhamnosyltransferase
MEIEALVVTHNSSGHIAACVDSLRANGAVPIVVDTGSADSTCQLAAGRDPFVKVIQAGANVGYGRALNLGFNHTAGEYVLLSNSDVVYLPSSVTRLVEFLEQNPDVGLVGPQQLFPDGSWQWSYGDLPGIWSGVKDAIGVTTFRHACRYWLWPRRIDRNPKDVPYVGGAVLLVRREAFEAVGGFDETFFPGGDECDLCARMQKLGWRTVFCPQAEVVHVRGGDFTHIPAYQHLGGMVDSQIRLARKYLPGWQASLYFWLEQIQFQRLSFTYKALRKLLPHGLTALIKKKGASAKDLADIWRDKRENSVGLRSLR